MSVVGHFFLGSCRVLKNTLLLIQWPAGSVRVSRCPVFFNPDSWWPNSGPITIQTMVFAPLFMKIIFSPLKKLIGIECHLLYDWFFSKRLGSDQTMTPGEVHKKIIVFCTQDFRTCCFGIKNLLSFIGKIYSSILWPVISWEKSLHVRAHVPHCLNHNKFWPTKLFNKGCRP